MQTIICNRCGKIWDAGDIDNGLSVHRYQSYGSKFDTDRVDFDLCTKCSDEFIENLQQICQFSVITEGECWEEPQVIGDESEVYACFHDQDDEDNEDEDEDEDEDCEYPHTEK